MSNELNDKSGLLITLTADIVSAHVSNNSVAVSDIPQLIENVHATLHGLNAVEEEEEEVRRTGRFYSLFYQTGLYCLSGRWQKAENAEAPFENQL